ncbi:hypothetical protein OKW76_04470 [Sphingomonas sp. S1-29]|uniref:hypothetical protein n=1 Tax=Sphingomonas sp. S1-29 TaxID=2991074 RepID=UPI00223FB18B|nr:hypothetical protein [Sphingomonas sp. S1-29]UZK70305.1 hypothetical protein OKW76_04470 [Sphingomonas sp. S1-29]
MNYFQGQLISDRDMRTEQEYFRAKLRHANRCLHGHGVLCGLEVRAVPPPPNCRPVDEDQREKLQARIAEYERRVAELKARATEVGADVKAIEVEIGDLLNERERLRRELETLGGYPLPADEPGERPGHVVELTCGAAIDCDGNDIIVRHPVKVDLDDLLKCGSHHDDGEEDLDADRFVYLSICYRECGREPTRPFELDECATSIRCHDARVAESWRLDASWRRPPTDDRCDFCCTSCAEACLLLARIRVERDKPVGAVDIDHAVRRRFGLYEPTVIAGINWRHGFEYSYDTAHALLGSKDKNAGLEIRFSRPVRRSSLTPGVVDLWQITGGGGAGGSFVNMQAEYVGLPEDPDATVDRVRIRNGGQERVQAKDRILVTVRTTFILDACCRPVEGSHVGGRVPRITDETPSGKAALNEEAKVEPPAGCVQPAHGPLPWTTGADGNFESWFYISEA